MPIYDQSEIQSLITRLSHDSSLLQIQNEATTHVPCINLSEKQALLVKSYLLMPISETRSFHEYMTMTNCIYIDDWEAINSGNMICILLYRLQFLFQHPTSNEHERRLCKDWYSRLRSEEDGDIEEEIE